MALHQHATTLIFPENASSKCAKMADFAGFVQVLKAKVTTIFALPGP